jgi:hypothetical protein
MDLRALYSAANHCDSLSIIFTRWHRILRLAISHTIRYGTQPRHTRNEASHTWSGRPDDIPHPPLHGIGEMDLWQFPWILISHLPAGNTMIPLV